MTVEGRGRGWALPVAGALPPIAGAAAAVLYDDPLLMLLVLAAGGFAGATPVALRPRRGAAGPGAALALAALLAALAVTRHGGVGPVAALRDVGASVPHLLSFAPPIPTRLDTLAPPLVVVWAAAFLAASLAAAGRRLLAAAPAVAVLTAALLLVGRAAPAPVWVAPVVGLGAAALLLADRDKPGQQGRQGRQPRRRKPGRSPGRGAAGVPSGVLLGAAVVAALLAAGLGAAGAAPSEDRVDVRARYQPPVERPQPIDPLTRLAGWAKGDQAVLATVRADGAPETAWRWAILDRYDGARWTSSLQYRPTGRRLRPRSDAPADAAQTVRAEVDLDRALAPWLPVPGTALQVNGLAVAVDAGGQSMVEASPSGRPPGYGLVAQTRRLDPVTRAADRAAIARFSVGEPATEAIAAPQLPEELRTIALRFAPQAGESDGQRALRLQDMLRNGVFAADAPPGHLYVRLTQFFDEKSPAYFRGTSEQFATAFAVLARAVGLPTRVVVGFDVRAAELSPVEVVGADMQAWPEVHFAGQGWVRLLPTPADRGGAPSTPPELDQVIPPAPTAQPAQPEPARGRGHEPAPPATRAPARSPLVTAAWWTAAAALAVLAATVLVVALLRLRLRAGRRRRPDPAQRVIGAWRELEDALDLARAGRGPAPAAAVAQRVSGRVGALAARDLPELARLANAAAFAPAGAVSAAEASRAWAISDCAAVSLKRSAPRVRRWSWWLRPGPLRQRG
jgi:transglutaminase-like putative cysteine protease